MSERLWPSIFPAPEPSAPAPRTRLTTHPCIFAQVRNYALFLRAAQESPASLNHCMRKAGVLSPR